LPPAVPEDSANTQGGRRGWIWLGVFWILVLLGFGGGAVTLAVLGPPPTEDPPAALAVAPAETPPPAPPAPRGVPESLARYLDPTLVEYTAMGALPRIGPDGSMPMRVYARPFDRQDPRPRVALILGGLGLRTSLSEQAIRTLPRNIALAFTPYAPNPAPLIEEARDRDFETLLALPMEPTGFPLNDPGHRALLTGLSAGENAQRLDWLLARFPGHVGAVGALASMRGERFAAMAEPFAQMQLALSARGLMYFDVRPGAPHPQRAWGLTVDVVVDEPHTRGEIDQRLALLERIARERGGALGYLGEVTPVALERLVAWTGGLDARGIALAPVTALVRRPEIATR
jgi:polysaccharide deacetylase 2 family uncharacterized protein YibQ